MMGLTASRAALSFPPDAKRPRQGCEVSRTSDRSPDGGVADSLVGPACAGAAFPIYDFNGQVVKVKDGSTRRMPDSRDTVAAQFWRCVAQRPWPVVPARDGGSP